MVIHFMERLLRVVKHYDTLYDETLESGQTLWYTLWWDSWKLSNIMIYFVVRLLKVINILWYTLWWDSWKWSIYYDTLCSETLGSCQYIMTHFVVRLLEVVNILWHTLWWDSWKLSIYCDTLYGETLRSCLTLWYTLWWDPQKLSNIVIHFMVRPSEVV